MACRLPVAFITASSMRGAWLDLVTGTVTYDPAGEFEIDQNGYAARSKAEPRLSGLKGALFYSQAAKRWLPVRRLAVSRDGRRYAYTDPFTGQPSTIRLHIADAGTGNETVYPLPGSGPAAAYAVIDFGSKGVTITSAYEGTRGVWRVDPSSGRVTAISSAINIGAVDGDTVWAGSVNPADPHPLPGFEDQPDQVDQITLGGGTATWLYQESTSLSVVGIDGHGSPIVLAFKNLSGDDAKFLLLTAPNTARTIFEAVKPPLSVWPTAIDQHGVWFASADGIYLLPDGGMLAKVSDVVATPAGGCV